MKKVQIQKKLSLKKQAVAMLKTADEAANNGIQGRTIVVKTLTVTGNPTLGCPPPDTIIVV